MITSDLLHDVDSELHRDLLERDIRLPYIRSAELKYKLSDLEAALNKSPITIRVSGYIQMDVNRAVERDGLLRWFQATWSPVGGQLGRSDEYCKWSRQDPEFHRVKVSGEPALATRGPGTPGRRKVCVCPNTPNLDSLIGPSCSHSTVRFVSALTPQPSLPQTDN
jgi:hypothetical protein